MYQGLCLYLSKWFKFAIMYHFTKEEINILNELKQLSRKTKTNKYTIATPETKSLPQRIRKLKF